jgi:hypothetical protein
MSNKTKYYRLTEWPLVKRWLQIGLLVLAVLATLVLIFNLKFRYCPGDTNCDTAPEHSLRDLL